MEEETQNCRDCTYLGKRIVQRKDKVVIEIVEPEMPYGWHPDKDANQYRMIV